jgi:hypothetical protein
VHAWLLALAGMTAPSTSRHQSPPARLSGRAALRSCHWGLHHQRQPQMMVQQHLPQHHQHRTPLLARLPLVALTPTTQQQAHHHLSHNSSKKEPQLTGSSLQGFTLPKTQQRPLPLSLLSSQAHSQRAPGLNSRAASRSGPTRWVTCQVDGSQMCIGVQCKSNAS